MTIGELKEKLEKWPNDYEVTFGDDALTFYRFKSRGDKLVDMEFNQLVYAEEPHPTT